jgi:hypothetical protein
LLQVLLVAETAAAGINKEAFYESLRYISRSTDYKEPSKYHPQRRNVLVLGPHFSGSQVSLERVLHAWQDPAGPTHFHVISGSASGILRERLNNAGGANVVEFHATVIPSQKILVALMMYLGLSHREEYAKDSKEYAKDKYHSVFDQPFAVLYESNTTFGQQAVQPERLKIGQPGALPVLFPFPLHVSEVRSEYDRSTAATQPAGILRLPAFGTKLRLSATQTNQPRDVEPSLDPSATAVLGERTLDAMLNDIARQRIKHVFILATDVKDTLFLAKLVRKYCPECRLVLPDSDMLYGHPEFSSDLRGSIVGSTYPLLARNQSWSYPFAGRRAQRVFTNNPEYGYYNATIALLHPSDTRNLLEYGPPFPEWCPPGTDVSCPPVWISVVGQGGFSPVAAVATTDKEFDEYMFPRDLNPPVVGEEEKQRAQVVLDQSSLGAAVLLGVTWLLCWVGVAYARAAFWPKTGGNPGRRPAEDDRDRGLFELFRPYADSRRRLRRRQRFYVFVCMTSSLVMFAFVAYIVRIPFLGQVASQEYLVEAPYWVRVAPVLLLTLLVAFLLLPAARAGQAVTKALSGSSRGDTKPAEVTARSSPPKWSKYIAKKLGEHREYIAKKLGEHRVGLLCVVLLMAMAAYAAEHRTQRQDKPSDEHLVFLTAAEPMFFFDRAANLTGGSSPVMPVILLGSALFLWGFVQLRRLSTRNRWKGVDPLPQPATDDEKTNLKQLEKCKLQIESHLTKPLASLSLRWWDVLACVSLVFALSRIAVRFSPAVDGFVFEGVLSLALATLAILIAASWMHMKELWGSVRELLRAVTLLPLQGAFQRIPGALTKALGSYLAYARDGRRLHMNYRRGQYVSLASDYANVGHHLRSVAHLPVAIKQDLQKAMAKDGDGKPADCEKLSLAAQALVRTLLFVRNNPRLAEDLLGKEPPDEAAAPEHTGGRPAGSPAMPPGFLAVRDWLARAEDFVALEVTIYLSQFFVQLSNVTLFLSVAPLLMLLAISSYPFQPQRSWLLLAGAELLVVTIFLLIVVARLERDELISRIQKTAPDQLSFHWAFLSHVLLYAAPLLAILMAFSSTSSDLLHTWLDPLLQILK